MSFCRALKCTRSNSLVNKSANCFTPSKCSNNGDISHVFQVTTTPLALYEHLNINITRPRSQNTSLICQRYIDWSRNPIVHYKVLPVHNHMVRCTGITHSPIRKSRYSLLLPKTLNLWYCPLMMSPCCPSPLIYSCHLSISDNSFSDGQPSHNENRCGFLCCLWLTSSNHLVNSTLF